MHVETARRVEQQAEAVAAAQHRQRGRRGAVDREALGDRGLSPQPLRDAARDLDILRRDDDRGEAAEGRRARLRAAVSAA